MKLNEELVAKVAKLITESLGTAFKLDIISIVVNEIGYSKLAKLANTSAGAIKTAFIRGSIGDELSYKIFHGLAKNKPHLLRFAFEIIVNKYDKLMEELLDSLKKLEDEEKKFVFLDST